MITQFKISRETLRKINEINNNGDKLSVTELQYYRTMIEKEILRLYQLAHITNVIPEQEEIYNESIPKLESTIQQISSLIAEKNTPNKRMGFSDLTRRIKQLSY